LLEALSMVMATGCTKGNLGIKKDLEFVIR
jgi:hypothetical protein